MSQLVKKKVIYDFRQEDIANKGQGAPLTPIFHNLLSKNISEKHQIQFPICFINIGGISNITKIIKNENGIILCLNYNQSLRINNIIEIKLSNARCYNYK